MDRSSSREPPTADKRLQTLAETFQGAWTNATSADLQRFLPPIGDPLRPAALIELVKADLKMRWQRKKPVLLEAYLKKFTELGHAQSVPAELILEEYMVRQLHGDKPDLATYQERFPSQYLQLEDLIRASETRAGDIPPIPPPSNASPSQSRVATAPSNVPPARPSMPPGPPQAATLAAAPAKPSQVIEGYTLIKRIGSGSFAEVWQGEAPGGFPVAIKRIIKPLDDDQAQRELLSLESIKNLRHLFLLQTHRTFLLDNQLYVVMELADGTLRDRMKQCQKEGRTGIPLHELMRYFRESAEALDYMHSQNLLHRDIKPHNILILNGHAKVADFGLAMLQESQLALMSASGSGTPAYMAPEVWKRKVSKQSDQYSLAFAYAEQRLGHWPFTGKSMAHLMMEHLNKKPELDPLPAAEQAVVHKALAKEPEERYPSCLEFVAALEEALADQLGKSRPSINIGSRGPMGPASKDNLTLPLDTRRKSVEALSRTAQAASVGTQSTPRSKLGYLVLLLLVAIGGGAAWHFFGGPKGSSAPFVLSEMAMPALRAGEVGRLQVHVKRHGYEGPIELTFPDLADVGQVENTKIAAGQDAIEVKLLVAPDAEQAKGKSIAVQANGEQVPVQQRMFALTIDGQAYSLPKSAHKAEGAKLREVNGRSYYDEIDIVPGTTPVRFLLIPREKETDPPTFYIMQDKVWAALFREFVASDKTPLRDDRWSKVPSNQEAENPVMGVVLADADRCARWLGGLLPTPKQWDKAAGKFQPNALPGPFIGAGDQGIALKLDRPMKRGSAENDRSPLGCRDMAGNGAEWTAKKAEEGEETEARTELDQLGPTDLIWLRGARYRSAEPYSFTAKSLPLLNTTSDSGIGFRVVLELDR